MLRKMFIQSVAQAAQKKKKQVLPVGAEPVTFCLLLQRFYHSATGDWSVVDPHIQIREGRGGVGGGGFGVLKKCFLTLWASVWSKNNNSVPPLDLPLLIIAKTTNYFWLFLFAIAWFCISSHISTSHCHDSVAAQDWTKHPSNICYKLSWYAGWQACYSTLSNVFLL